MKLLYNNSIYDVNYYIKKNVIGFSTKESNIIIINRDDPEIRIDILNSEMVIKSKDNLIVLTEYSPDFLKVCYKFFCKKEDTCSGFNKNEFKNIKIQSEHNIFIKNENIKKIILRLQSSGFSGYLVGGCVRDLLLKQKVHDFDIITDAQPNQITKLFNNSKIIGKRFPICLIKFKNEVFELITFRKPVDETNPVLCKQNPTPDFSDSLFEDYQNRDFTINALYYNYKNRYLIDPSGSGYSDLKNKIIRFIGDPKTRIRCDPLRMIRAIRFSGKLNFKIDPIGYQEIINNKELILSINSSRLNDEFSKLFYNDESYYIFIKLERVGISQILFPFLKKNTLIMKYLKDPVTDRIPLLVISSLFIDDIIQYISYPLTDYTSELDRIILQQKQIINFTGRDILSVRIILINLKNIFDQIEDLNYKFKFESYSLLKDISEIYQVDIKHLSNYLKKYFKGSKRTKTPEEKIIPDLLEYNLENTDTLSLLKEEFKKRSPQRKLRSKSKTLNI